MTKVLCFGELLLRLSPQLGGAWIAQNSMPVFIGGAELNAATALAAWGVPVGYCTALPDHYLSKEIIASVEGRGVDASMIQLSGSRIGTYYLPQGGDMKSAGVIYDRAYSSFWELASGQIDWDRVLDGVSWLAFSAISPALNANVAAVCLEGAKAASAKGITVAIDLNYRAKLWQWGKTPHEVMPELVEQCDIVMGNLWAEERMLDIPVPENLPDEKEAYLEQSQRTSEAVMARFPKCKQVANTFRFDRTKGLHYYATLYTSNQLFVSAQHQTVTVVDRVGSGDTFMAGLLYGGYHNHPPQQVIDFAAAAAFTKLFIKGDASNASVEEVNRRQANHV